MVLLCGRRESWRRRIAAFREAIRLDPDEAPNHSFLGFALKTQAKLDEAIAAYREAIRIEPNDASDITPFLVTLCRGRESWMRQSLSIARPSGSTRTTPHITALLGDCSERAGKLDEAIAAYREAIRINAGRRLISQRSLVMLWTDRKSSTTPSPRTARRSGIKPNEAAVSFVLGHVSAKTGKADDAIAAFREAIRIKPGEALYHSFLGHALLTDESSTRPSRHSARPSGSNLTKPEFTSALASRCKADEKLDAAIAAYREAIRLKPDYAEAHFSLGGRLVQQGKFDEAEAEFAEAKRLKPDIDEEPQEPARVPVTVPDWASVSKLKNSPRNAYLENDARYASMAESPGVTVTA